MSELKENLESLYSSLSSEMIYFAKEKDYTQAKEVGRKITDTLQELLDIYMKESNFIKALEVIKMRAKTFSLIEKFHIMSEGGLCEKDSQNVKRGDSGETKGVGSP